MTQSKFLFHHLPILIFIGIFFSFLTAANASAGSDSLTASDQEKIDAYIHSRMRIAHIPELALWVVRGDQVI